MKRKILIWVVLSALLLSARAMARQPVALPVVMYHHISKNPKMWNDYVISPAEFEADLVWLRDHGYQTVRLRELLAWEQGEGTLPEKPCMITFDDGFESTAAYAEPLMAQYGFCGVVAVIGSVCERFSALDDYDPEYDNLSWEDARSMAERGNFEVVCHSWALHGTYPRMGCRKRNLESEEAYRYALTADLSQFLTACTERGVPLSPAIAYPFGAYCRETTEAVRDFGFLAAFTCNERINRLTGSGEELYDIGRFNRPHGPSSESFFARWEENS